MSHNLESMFYVGERNVPWHKLGTMVQEAPNSEEAIRLAGLDWEVKSLPIYLQNNQVIEGLVANTRVFDYQVYGVVTPKYKIIQNNEAFQFTDHLLGRDVKYETAGSLQKGKVVWLLAKMPNFTILGDEIENYVVFTNSHDGKNAVRVAVTPVRVVCQNTLNLALNGASRIWSTRHMGNIQDKLHEASRTLELTHLYVSRLTEYAERLANTTLTNAHTFVENLFPMPNTFSDRLIRNINERRSELLFRYENAPDLNQIRGTAWGMLNAVTDYITHSEPQRKTEQSKERLFSSVITTNNSIVERATKLLEMV